MHVWASYNYKLVIIHELLFIVSLNTHYIYILESSKMYVPCLDICAEEIMKGFCIACSMLNLSNPYFFPIRNISWFGCGQVSFTPALKKSLCTAQFKSNFSPWTAWHFLKTYRWSSWVFLQRSAAHKFSTKPIPEPTVIFTSSVFTSS